MDDATLEAESPDADAGRDPASRDGVDRGPPWVAAVGGLVASGKSTIARALAERRGAVRIEADAVRDELAGAAPRSLLASPADDPMEERIYGELLRRGAAVLAEGRPLVLDACFARASERRAARELAGRFGAAFAFVECRTPADVARERIREREASEPGWREIDRALADRWEPVAGSEGSSHVVVSGGGPVETALATIGEGLAAIAARRRQIPVADRPAAVTFDCWNTLLVEDDWSTAHAIRVARLRGAASEAGRPSTHEEAVRAFDAAWQRHMRLWGEGRASGAREIAIWGLAELGVRNSHPALEHLVRGFEEASHSSRVRSVGGARQTLVALARANVACALVCDTGLTPGRVVRRHLERLGLLEGLAIQVFSDEVGVPKPDPRAFRAALSPLGVEPDRALHVGDLRRTDVAGARELGMKSVRLREPHDDRSDLPEADFVVDSHAELRALLALES